MPSGAGRQGQRVHACMCVRVQVESELRLLMDRLRALATAAPFSGSAVRSRDPESVVPKAGAKDKVIVDYLAASSSLVSAQRARRACACRGLAPCKQLPLPT